MIEKGNKLDVDGTMSLAAKLLYSLSAFCHCISDSGHVGCFYDNLQFPNVLAIRMYFMAEKNPTG